jgi:hypothetical protein
MLVIENTDYSLFYLSWKKLQDNMSVEVNLEMTFCLQQAYRVIKKNNSVLKKVIEISTET